MPGGAAAKTAVAAAATHAFGTHKSPCSPAPLTMGDVSSTARHGFATTDAPTIVANAKNHPPNCHEYRTCCGDVTITDLSEVPHFCLCHQLLPLAMATAAYLEATSA